MEITFDKKQNLEGILTINLTPADYQPRIKSELKKAQKKVNMPGFRPGNAPLAMVEKMYGKSIFVDEVNKMVSEAMFGYLSENQVHYLAQPMLSETESQNIDFSVEGDFSFVFEVGLAPEVKINIESSDTVTKHKILVDEAEVEKEIENIQRRFAEEESVQQAEAEDIIYLTVSELDANGEIFEGGVSLKSVSTTLSMVQDEDTKNQLAACKTGDVIQIDIFKVFNNNETVISSALGIPKEGVNDLNPNFTANVNEIKRFIKAELNQDLFDKVLGEGEATDLESFKAKIRVQVEAYYAQESENMFNHMISHLIDDRHAFDLPGEFLKRWIKEKKREDKEGATLSDEEAENIYNNEAPALRRMLIRDFIFSQNNITVEDAEIENMSMYHSQNLIRQYGIPNPDYNLVKQISDKKMKDESHKQQMLDIVSDSKLINYFREIVTPLESEISIEDFYALMQEHTH